MADEQVVVVAEETPAPVTEGTAPAATEVSTTPEVPAEPAPPKLFTQEELDAAVGKRLAIQQRKWEREHGAAPAAPTVGELPEGVTPEALALAERIADQREAKRKESQVLEAYEGREDSAREKYDDFDQVTRNPRLPITEVMKLTIHESDLGPEILYHLGNDPGEARRIAQLSPVSQAKEIGKLETKLSSNPPAKRTSSAPAPITPVTARGVVTPTYDTTDPRAAKELSTSEWIAKDRERLMKKASANR